MTTGEAPAGGDTGATLPAFAQHSAQRAQPLGATGNAPVASVGAPEGVRVGQRVTVQGLQKRQDLNGLSGEVIEEEGGYLRVRFDDASIGAKALKPSNLRPENPLLRSPLMKRGSSWPQSPLAGRAASLSQRAGGAQTPPASPPASPSQRAGGTNTPPASPSPRATSP